MMKDVELRLISELMKNSRRSDRELAGVSGVSQPTVSRAIKRLEKQGYLKEYTAIPDFAKLGFEIMSFTFVKLMREDESAIKENRKWMREEIARKPVACLLALAGMGMNVDRMVVAFHQNHSEYEEFITRMTRHPLVNIQETKTFLVNLLDESHFHLMTYYGLAEYIAEMKKKDK
jgi:DNA-binding Lrp family transcriptional regulator